MLDGLKRWLCTWLCGGTGTSSASKAAADIRRNRVAYEDMVRRARLANVTVPPVAAEVLNRFDELAARVAAAADSEELRQMVQEAETLAASRAYLCPEKEISTEARSYLFTLAGWGVPARNLDAIREAAAPALSGTDAATGRAALYLIYDEFDSWSEYMDKYDANTGFWASVFLLVIAAFTIAALVMMFGFVWRLLGLVIAAVAGAVASVISRLPGLTSYGEWQVNLRAYQARIGTGIVGSLVGIGLLGSGLISISLPKEWHSADVLLEACLDRQGVAKVPATPPATGATADRQATKDVHCTPGGALFLIAITMLLGFSERVLTTLESRVVPAPAASLMTAQIPQPTPTPTPTPTPSATPSTSSPPTPRPTPSPPPAPSASGTPPPTPPRAT